jgi:Zn finger protein HypA/HybF involved in hydrogenase expression
MNKLKYHLDMSKQICKCKNCKKLIIPRFLDDIYCEKCGKEYIRMINHIINT